eukprot:CAMPEP_0185028022 /NCGR_PEP_ID=MMETSP1103-20130426/13436_1 /TAXON_ID=36769 /ORGANISM="Paraphysomonas bandaiensis, Strain Caron Lab Isolate" /LENGTH=308 /DNA_ID=CAMNT_0027562251 /DNA_START=71 /DNA_END=997 /DNA_ORIENTATION=+
MSPVDVEKELFRMRRLMGGHFSRGAFEEALNVARALEAEIANIMGTGNAAHASCFSNIGLMLKQLGKNEDALENYNRSLEMYENVVGVNHPSYITTLSNIGVLHKTMAEAATEEEVFKSHINEAKECLSRALELRESIGGDTNSKDLLIYGNHLANVMRVLGEKNEAETRLRSILHTSREQRGDWDSITALTLNNLGLVLKQLEDFTGAEKCYAEALEIRCKLYGEKHHDCVITLHNIAELHRARGDEDKAKKVQENIIKLLGEEHVPEQEKWSDQHVYESLPKGVKGEVPIEDKRPMFDPKNPRHIG